VDLKLAENNKIFIVLQQKQQKRSENLAKRKADKKDKKKGKKVPGFR